MDWANERYARVYTRDTTTWKLLTWEARALLVLLLRKVDRMGVLEVGLDGHLGMAAHVEMPPDVVERALAQLVARGVVVDADGAYVLPNFLEAQEAVQTDAHRSREYRARKRDEALHRDGVTKRDVPITKRDKTVTPRHTASRSVTPNRTDPDCTEPSRAVPGDGEGFDPFAVASDDMSGPEPQWWGNHPRPPAAATPPAKPKAKRKASQMPDGWMPEPYTVPPNVDPKLELARFRDWAAAKAATFVDWNAAWRNWLRKAAEFARGRTPPRPSSQGRIDQLIRIAGGDQ